MEPLILIVDDEHLCRDYVHDLIHEFRPEAKVLEASSAIQAREIIKESSPDLLFLDVKMPEQDGFSVFEKLEERDFEVVFITAYSNHAVNAFKHGACDYLLKPIDKQEFKLSLERALLRREKELKIRDLESKKQTVPEGRLSINRQSGMLSIDLKNILSIKADNTSSVFYLDDGSEVVSSKSLQYYEETLDPAIFMRVHKSSIVNLFHVKEYNNAEEKQLLLSDGSRLNISRYRLSAFLKVFKEF